MSEKSKPKVIENRYARGKIYKIISPQKDECYVGSTCEKTLSRRMTFHRSDFKKYINKKGRYMSSFDIMKLGDAKIVLLESFPCSSKDELFSREQHWIDETDCVNKINAFGINKEKQKIYKQKYYVKNKESLDNYNKKYRENNKDKIEKIRKKYYAENKDTINKRRRETASVYRERNKDNISKTQKKYRAKNRDRINERQRKYYYKNKEIKLEKLKKLKESQTKLKQLKLDAYKAKPFEKR